MASNPAVVVDFVANTAKMSEGMKGLSGLADGVRKNWKKIAVGVGAAAVAGGVKIAKDSIDATQQLAKDTMALTRVTGMDTKTASAWVSVLKTRGIGVDQFNVGMVKLSKTMSAASDGNKTASAAFKELGVNMDDVRKGNTQAVILQVADGLAKIENPARRAALTQQLFGKSGQKLAPILNKGSGAIQEQLQMAEKYGAVLGDKTTKQVADLAAQQREMKLAFQGVKIQLGTALMPLLLELVTVFTDIVREIQPVIAAILKMGVKAIKPLIPVAVDLAKILGDALLEALNALAPVMPDLAKALAQVLKAVAPLLPPLVKLAADVLVVMVKALSQVISWLAKLVSWFTKLLVPLLKNKPLLIAIGVAVAALVGPIGLAVAAVIGLIKYWDNLRKAFSAAAGWLVSAGTKLIGGFVKGITGAYKTVTSAAATVQTYAVKAVTGAISWLVSYGKSTVQGFVAGVKNVIGTVATELAGIKTRAVNAVTGAVSWLTNFGRSTVTGFVSGVTGVLGNVATAVGGIHSRALNAVSGAIGWLVGFGKNTVTGFVNGVGEFLGNVASKVGQIEGKVTGAISKPLTWLYNAGANIVQGLINGIGSKFKALGSKLSSMANKVKDIPKKIWNLFSPSRVFQGMGVNIVQGLIDGITRTTPNLVRATEGLANVTLAAGVPAAAPTLAASSQAPQVRVYIGDQELRGIVRTEVVTEGNRTAAVLLGGVA